MKKHIITILGMLGLGISAAQAQTVQIASWENSYDGWSILETGNWSSLGFSSTTGVTSGTYSWGLSATSVDYGPTLQGPSSTANTLLMANANTVSLDIYVTGGDFSWGMQWDLEVNQPGGAGTISVDGYNYPGDDYGPFNTEMTISWPVSQAVRSALDANPSLPTYLTISCGGGGAGTVYIDNLRVTKIPQVQTALAVRELWDDLPGDQNPTATSVTDNTSSLGFDSSSPWVPNPLESGIGSTPDNTQLMQFRTGFYFEESAVNMGLPGSLDGTGGAMVQQNNNISFFPATLGGSFWTSGDWMTRALSTANYINFSAVGEYWFTATVQEYSSDSQYVTLPSSGGCGFGFADNTNANANFVAIGLTPPNLYLGASKVNASSSVYVSTGTLGQAGDPYSVANYNPITLGNSANPPDGPPNYAPPYNSEYSETNFTGGPYYVSAFGADSQGDAFDSTGNGIILLGHLKTCADGVVGSGNATLDAKFYYYNAPNGYNNAVDVSPVGITWDVTGYAFNFQGTMTEALLFENGQFSSFVDGFRASSSFTNVMGLDPGRIGAYPLQNTYVGYPLELTNYTVEALPNSFYPALGGGYGTLTNQWFFNGTAPANALAGANNPYYNIASAASGNAGTYYCITGDISGQWGTVTNSIQITVTPLPAPVVTDVEQFNDGTTFQVTYSEPNLQGVGQSNHYVFNNGVVVTNVQILGGANSTVVQLQTTTLPVGTKVTMTISDATNAVNLVLATTNLTFWTDLIQPGAANWQAWAEAASGGDGVYFGTFLPANPFPPVLDSQVLTSWEGPSSGVSINGGNGPGTDFGDTITGWFVPPVTGDYVFFMSTDDGGRLWLSTNSSNTNMFVIACETDWSPADNWTNFSDTYPSQPHRGDGTSTGVAAGGGGWDNSTIELSGAQFADDQNRSDQFIVAYFDGLGGGTGLPYEPAGATTAEQSQWASTADISQGSMATVVTQTNFWPKTNSLGQAEITLTAGKYYAMKLEHVQNTGGYDESVTYKLANQPDPVSPSATIMTGNVIAGLVPFTPSISISAGPPVKITYTGVLRSSPSVTGPFTTVVAQSAGGASVYTPPLTGQALFYITGE